MVRSARPVKQVSLRSVRSGLRKAAAVATSARKPAKRKQVTLPIELDAAPPEPPKPAAPPQPKVLFRTGQYVPFTNPKGSVDIGRVISDAVESILSDGTVVKPQVVNLWLGKLPHGADVTKSVPFADVGKE